MSPNPFRPGTASIPPHLAGRDEILNIVNTTLASHGNNFGSFLALYGARGQGKTSLLETMTRSAAMAGWPTVSVEVSSGEPFLRPLLAKLQSIEGLPRKLSAKLAATGAAWSEQEQELDLKVYRRTARRAARQLPIAEPFIETVTDLVRHQSSRASGLCITIDEVQNTEPAELTPIGPLVQQLSKMPDQTIMIGLAGLPSMQQHLTKAFTYSERWMFRDLDNLSVSDAAAALAIPAAEAGRAFTAEAVHRAAQISAGYPFAVQLIGFSAWNASENSNEITLEHVQAANAQFRNELEHGLYRQRWESCSPLERGFLAAAAHHADSPVPIRAIAKRLGRQIEQLDTPRARLIESGSLMYTIAGTVEEAIPGLFDYIRERSDSDTAIARAFASRPANNPP